MSEGYVSVEMMADDAAAVLRALDVPSAHAAGFSGGSIVCQELALRRLVLQSTWPVMDPYLRSWLPFVRWLVEVALSDARSSRGSSWTSTPRGRTTTGPSTSSEEMLAFPHKQATEDLEGYLDAFAYHDTIDRLPEIAAPTLVIAGGRDMTARPPLPRAVAELIPGAWFEIMEGRGPPALPRGTRRVEHARRCVLAGGRGGRLKSATQQTNGTVWSHWETVLSLATFWLRATRGISYLRT
jgi:3-oxoadipate enol-lactonase